MPTRLRPVIVSSLTGLLLVSCSPEKIGTERDRTQNRQGIAVRYLEEITCDESNYNCYKEEVIKRIQELCAEIGFRKDRPVSGVTYSRATTEPIRGTVIIVNKITEFDQITDAIGVVTSQKVIREHPVKEDVSGYCIGSEYIVSE